MVIARLASGLRVRVAVVVALVSIGALFGASAAQAQGYSVQLMHWNVRTGPGNAKTCNIIGQLYKPDSASAAHPVPVVLGTNGFGGSYKDQDGMAATLAKLGYGFLTYSGLGFGGSTCQIELDSPTWDGTAASQLITFLGGGSAATNGTTVNWVIHEKKATNGVVYKYDPDVGMIGGSYGGEIQFATADVDPRVRTIIPVITWNNLAYSLAPNNADLTGNELDEFSGVAKFEWIDLFSADGIIAGVENVQPNPGFLLTGCPDFDARACSAMISLNATGNASPATLAFAEEASVESYIHKVRIPTMLMQGEDDTLFNLHEAIANYTELKAQGTPVKMVWQSWGHSDATAAPGEYSGSLLNPDGSETVEGRMVIEWFNHYLKGAKAAPALDVSFFRPWVKYSGNDAAAAYASAPSYPIGSTEKLYMSNGSAGLVSGAGDVASGTTTFITPPAGVPLSTTEISAESQTIPLFDTPGTFASYQSAPLTKTIDVVGMPRVTVSISSTLSDTVDGLDPSGGLALFFKLEDITPSGAILPDRLISPVRIEDFNSQVQVTLPGIVHQFPASDSLKLIIAASDAAYRGTTIPVTVSVMTSPSDPGVLTLPVANSGSYTPVVFASVPHKAKHRR